MQFLSRYSVAAFLALIVLPLSVAMAQSTPKFPQVSGRVVDKAELLSPATEAQITQMLQAHEQETTEQVVVVTLPDLQGYPIEDYGYQFSRTNEILNELNEGVDNE